MAFTAKITCAAFGLMCVAGAQLLLAEEPALRPIERDSVDKDYSAELPRTPPTEADAAIATMSIVPGFRVELAAAEPLISDPIAMAFDADGAAFVVEMRGYSEDDADRLGVIRRIVDTDGDGTFDRGTDYVSGLSWPTAVACYDGGIFVGVAPDILYCRDTDQDGIADTRQVVFTGFGRQNVQGLLNSFIWGLDNRLYGATSSNGGTIRSMLHPEVEPIVLRGSDFAIDPAEMRLSVVSGGGQHGMSFDQWGERFVSSNSDHLQWIENDQGASAGHSRKSIAADGPAAEVFRDSPVEPWRIVRTRLRVKGMVVGPVEGGGRAAGYFTGATGVTIYQGDLFPDEFQTATIAFVGDVGSNLVHRKRIIDVGLSKVAQRIDPDREFLASTDPWFRPAQFANGPDGALYVLDMYREVIEHPKSLPPMIKRHLDLTSGRDRGRIYRVVPTEAVRRSRLLPANATDKQLVEMLGHPNGWHRETAARVITQGKAERWIPLLLRAALEGQSPRGQVRALYCLHTLQADGNVDPAYPRVLARALAAAHPQVRRHAIRLAALSSRQLAADGREALRSLVQDEDPRVRLQLARSLPNFDWADRVTWLTQLALADVSEQAMRLAILDSLPDASDTVRLVQPLLASANFVAQPQAVEFLLEAMRRIGRANHPRAIQLCLGELRAGTSTRETAIAPSQDILINALLSATGKSGTALRQLLDLPSADTFLEDWTRATLDELRTTDLPPGIRAAAIERLRIADFDDASPALKAALSLQASPVVREAAIDVLLSFQGSRVNDFLFDALPDLAPAARRLAIGRLVSRAETAKRLLGGLRDGPVLVADLMPYREQLMSSSDAALSGLAQQVWANQETRTEVLVQYEPVLSASGRPTQGRLVFGEVCATCHRLDGLGNAIGPDLSTVRDRGARFMLTNIIDPNRELDRRYESYTAILEDGRTLSGMLTEDAGSQVTMIGADGKPTAIARHEISRLRASGKSLMPEGLEQVLDVRKMADLLAFLVEGGHEPR